MRPCAVILAAGISRRFGGDKLRALWGSEPLLAAFLRSFPRELFAHVLVVTTSDRLPLVPAGFMPVENLCPDAGQGLSIALGARRALELCGRPVPLVYFVADQPLLEPATIAGLLSCWQGRQDRALALAAGGKTGNPVCFPAFMATALARLTPGEKGKDALRRAGCLVETWDCGDAYQLADCDRPEQMVALRDEALRRRRAALRRALLPASPATVALVGAGGKTSTLYLLGKALAEEGAAVALLNGTHMAPGPLPARDRFVLPEAGQCLFFARPGTEGKLLPLDPWPTRPDGCWFLVEADGAARRPLKAPADHEPALPPGTNRVIWVGGGAALGHPISACHRPERVAAVLGKDGQALIAPGDLAALALSPQGGCKGVDEAMSWRALLTGPTERTAMDCRMIGSRATAFDGWPQEVDGACWC